MLVIRMQRTGRKGHAMFRVVVQDSRRTPTSGNIVAALGSYDPHAKTVSLDKEKAKFYLEHGAQPSDRVTALLKSEGVKLPDWVQKADKKSGKIRNVEKLRRNRPPEPKAEEPAEPVAEEAAPVEETLAAEAPAQDDAAEAAEATETPEEVEAPAEPAAEEASEPEAEAPAEEAAPEEPAAEAHADDEKTEA